MSDSIMKMRNSLISILIIALLATSTTPAQTDAPREDTLWSAGHWSEPGVFNPTHWGSSWESIFMYEVLFDFNSENEGNEIFGVIGESISWNNDGSKINIKLRSEPKWTDGSAIDADDVVYTFWDLYAKEGFPLNGTYTKKVDSIVKVDATTVEVNLKANFKYSREVFFTFVGRWQVLPAHIWPDVIAHYGGEHAPTVSNNWLEDGFPEKLKVASGLYLPHSIAVDKSWSLSVKNVNWWGVGVIADKLPEPKYIGMKKFKTNSAQSSAYVKDEIDWMGGYVANIGPEIKANPNLGTYYEDKDPYFPSLSSIVEVTPNHFKYPMSEHWFREMIAYSLNIQDMIDIGASGYMEQARVGRIDDRSKTLDDFYDPKVEETYGFKFNLTKAKEILNANAILDGGKWYTKDAPADINKTIYSDELPSVAGFNVLIDNYEMKTVSGWSDFELHAKQFEKNVEELGIGITTNFVEYGAWVNNVHAMDYDFMIYGVGPHGLSRPLTHFTYFVGEAGQDVNITGWYNPEYVATVDKFELAAPKSTDEMTYAHKLQEILAKDLPSIPLFMNGYWYSYTKAYWQGWPVKGGDLPPVAMWSFSAQGLLNKVVLNLTATPASSEGSFLPLNIAYMMMAMLVMTPIVRRSKK